MLKEALPDCMPPDFVPNIQDTRTLDYQGTMMARMFNTTRRKKPPHELSSVVFSTKLSDEGQDAQSMTCNAPHHESEHSPKDGDVVKPFSTNPGENDYLFCDL